MAARELEGKSAIVTGASSGIGAAIAEAMAAAGARVVVSGRDHERRGAVAERSSAGGGESVAVETGVCGPDAPGRLVEAALEAFGAIDSIVHSAGIFWPKPFGETSLADLDR